MIEHMSDDWNNFWGQHVKVTVFSFFHFLILIPKTQGPSYIWWLHKPQKEGLMRMYNVYPWVLLFWVVQPNSQDRNDLSQKQMPWTFGQFLGMKSFIQFPPIDFQSGYPRVPLAAGPKSGSDEPLGRAVAWASPPKIKVGKIPNKNDKFMAIYEWM